MGVHAAGGTPAADRAVTRTEGGGWVIFAGSMLLILATLNIIYGIGAIDNSSFYVNDANYVFSDLNTWGWIVLLTGCAQMLCAFGIWARNNIATAAGIAFAGLNAIVQLLMIPAFPFLAIALFGVNILVIYGLAVHGGRQEELF